MRHRFAAPCLVLLLLVGGPCAAQLPGAVTLPGLTLESLPRPSMPPAERGPVVPAQVERWRKEAQAHEHGDGAERDPVRAAQLYCRASRFGDAEAQYLSLIHIFVAGWGSWLGGDSTKGAQGIRFA